MLNTTTIYAGNQIDCSSVSDLDSLVMGREMAPALAIFDAAINGIRLPMPFHILDHLTEDSNMNKIMRPVCLHCLEAKDDFASYLSDKTYSKCLLDRGMTKVMRYWLICSNCRNERQDVSDDTREFMCGIISRCCGKLKGAEFRDGLMFYFDEMHNATNGIEMKTSEALEKINSSIKMFFDNLRNPIEKIDIVSLEDQDSVSLNNHTILRSDCSVEEDLGDVIVSLDYVPNIGKQAINYKTPLDTTLEAQDNDLSKNIELCRVIKYSPQIYTPDSVGMTIPLQMHHDKLFDTDRKRNAIFSEICTSDLVKRLIGMKVLITTNYSVIEPIVSPRKVRKYLKYRSSNGIESKTLRISDEIPPLSSLYSKANYEETSALDIVYTGDKRVLNKRFLVNSFLDREEFLHIDIHGCREYIVGINVIVHYYFKEIKGMRRNDEELQRFLEASELCRKFMSGSIKEGFYFNSEKKHDYQNYCRYTKFEAEKWPWFCGKIKDMSKEGMMSEHVVREQILYYQNQIVGLGNEELTESLMKLKKKKALRCTLCAQKSEFLGTSGKLYDARHPCRCAEHKNPSEFVFYLNKENNVDSVLDRTIFVTMNKTSILSLKQTMFEWRWISHCDICGVKTEVIPSSNITKKTCLQCYSINRGYGRDQMKYVDYVRDLSINVVKGNDFLRQCDDCACMIRDRGPGRYRKCYHLYTCSECYQKEICYVCGEG